MLLVNSAATVPYSKENLMPLLVAVHCLRASKYPARVGAQLTPRKLNSRYLAFPLLKRLPMN
jgi:hypothetical protein